MLRSLMVFWLASAKWDRKPVQSLRRIFWVDVSLLCPRTRAATYLAMLVWGWSWLQPDPRRALWLWLFQADKGWYGASPLSATVYALHPPLPPTVYIMVWLCSLQHHNGTCVKEVSVFLFGYCCFLFCFLTSVWCCVCGVTWVSVGLHAQNINSFQTRIYGWKIHPREILSFFTERK